MYLLERFLLFILENWSDGCLTYIIFSAQLFGDGNFGNVCKNIFKAPKIPFQKLNDERFNSDSKI